LRVPSPVPIAVAIVAGIQTSKTTPASEPWNPGGATPTIVSRFLFSRMLLPSAFGSLRNWVCHIR